jgi:hypothetical protein
MDGDERGSHVWSHAPNGGAFVNWKQMPDKARCGIDSMSQASVWIGRVFLGRAISLGQK